MDRIPPNNPEAEKSVLGAAMLSKDKLFDALERLEPEDFYNKNNGEIFAAIKALEQKNSQVDSLTVADELKKRGTLDLVGGRGYISSLPSEVPSAANIGEHIQMVVDKAGMRKLIETAVDIQEECYKETMDASAIMDFAEKNIFEVVERKQKKDVEELKDVIKGDLKVIGERYKNRGSVMGVPSGLDELDRKTAGFQNSDLIILAARPSMGKTAFALTVGRNAARKKNRVLFFSVEMAKEQLSQRLLAMESGVDVQKIRTGDFTAEDWSDIMQAANSLSTLPIEIDDTPGIRIMEIKNKCRRLKAEKGLDMIVLDYLQLLSGDGRAENRQQEISMLSREMKQLAREMECPVIVLSQLSRAPELRADHRPILSDLRESGSIEQDADLVVFLYRDEVYNDEAVPGLCEVILAKHRNGPTGNIKVTWQETRTRFVNYYDEEAHSHDQKR